MPNANIIITRRALTYYIHLHFDLYRATARLIGECAAPLIYRECGSVAAILRARAPRIEKHYLLTVPDYIYSTASWGLRVTLIRSLDNGYRGARRHNSTGQSYWIPPVSEALAVWQKEKSSRDLFRRHGD